MPIQKEDLIEIKKSLEAEMARNNINPERRLAVEQELQSIDICLKEK